MGVDPGAVYDSLRAPRPEVVEAMINLWRDITKKPSRVALVVDTSGSMDGDKLPAVQRSLQSYLAQIGPRDVVGLIDFDDVVRPPVVLRGGASGGADSAAVLGRLQVGGTTHLHDAVLAGRDWLRSTAQPGEILAVVALTDGMDAGSKLTLNDLEAQLKRGVEGKGRISVFTVGFGDDSSGYNADVLRRLAEGNGGEFVEGDTLSIHRRMDDMQQSF
ncbi:MAG: vWA domain-containing protein [Cyanobacteriota bacterium]